MIGSQTGLGNKLGSEALCFVSLLTRFRLGQNRPLLVRGEVTFDA
jgi:hypothetical protein